MATNLLILPGRCNKPCLIRHRKPVLLHFLPASGPEASRHLESAACRPPSLPGPGGDDQRAAPAKAFGVAAPGVRPCRAVRTVSRSRVPCGRGGWPGGSGGGERRCRVRHPAAVPGGPAVSHMGASRSLLYFAAVLLPESWSSRSKNVRLTGMTMGLNQRSLACSATRQPTTRDGP